MSIPTVNESDTFDVWRIKTNEIATLEGDLAALSTTSKTNLVSAINESVANVSALARETLVRSIAMA